jgi:hypothetical protein
VSLDKDEAEIRRFIVSEVVSQMKPFADDLKACREWQLSFWSNGVGKVPGFFQLRMQQDDARNAIVTDYIRTAQKRQREEEFRKRDRDAQWRFWWPIIKWVGGGLATTFLALAMWLGPKIIRVGTALVEDYLKSHPALTEKLKTGDAQHEPVLSWEKPPQDAGTAGSGYIVGGKP